MLFVSAVRSARAMLPPHRKRLVTKGYSVANGGEGGCGELEREQTELMNHWEKESGETAEGNNVTLH